MTRREELDNIFKGIDKDKKTLINNLIDEVIFLEEQMEKLRKLPFIRVNPENSAMPMRPRRRAYPRVRRS